jgi:hypothetical protein
MLSRMAFLAFAAVVCAFPAGAATLTPVPMTPYKTTIQNLGTGFALGLPLLATGLTLARHDRAGSAELLVATVLSVGTAYALQNFVREDRPDHSSMHAFPALQTALAGSSSSFILERYGWREGLPAFAASGFVSFALNQEGKMVRHLGKFGDLGWLRPDHHQKTAQPLQCLDTPVGRAGRNVRQPVL